MKSRLFQSEPKWFAHYFTRQTLARDLQSWLFESESLTQRLRNQFENIHVNVLFEQQQTPFLTEQRILKLAESRYCLVREVILLSNQTPLILARTVIPAKTLKIAQGNLARLGSRPLGEILFSAPSLKREPLGFSKIEPDLWANNLHITAPLWGRRTKYSICNQPMLVSEFFLPALFL
jgi:chorismate--pyruvate lyase